MASISVTPQKRIYIEREAKSEQVDAFNQRKRRKLSTNTKRSKSCTLQTTRKSKRLANKNRIALLSDTASIASIASIDDNRRKAKHNENYNDYLFDESCLYSLLEVFLVGYNLNYGTKHIESVRDDLWEWLWFWEQRASAYYRILITPVYEHNLFEIRVDSMHGIHCGLLSEFLLNGLTFEYYYSYSRDNIWGGWQFCCDHKTLKHDIYGNIFNDNQCIQPSKIWKQIIWFKQLKMELMYKKYGGVNMNKMHLTHYYYGHHNFNEIDGNHEVYINKLPPYQLQAADGKKRDKFDVYSYNMAQIFDNSWSKNHFINRDSIQLNVDDLSLILGTKEKMKCAQCYQSFHLCRAIKLCDCFKGCFVFKDLYQRHKSMVMDWK